MILYIKFLLDFIRINNLSLVYRFDLELHAVHADDEQPQNFAVISVLYKIGHSPDPFLAKVCS